MQGEKKKLYIEWNKSVATLKDEEFTFQAI